MLNEENQSHAVQVADKRELSALPDFNAPVKLIADFVSRPDFPECTLGEHLDIGGFTGVVVAVVKQSLKVKSSEGPVRSFKSYGLQRLYGPPVELPPEPEPEKETFSQPFAVSPAREVDVPKAAPQREVVEEPNFDQPTKPIVELLAKADFPKCALGQQVEIGGYTGVVVEIANQSLKVRSPEGTSRNYNVPLLRNIYGKGVKEDTNSTN